MPTQKILAPACGNPHIYNFNCLLVETLVTPLEVVDQVFDRLRLLSPPERCDAAYLACALRLGRVSAAMSIYANCTVEIGEE